MTGYSTKDKNEEDIKSLFSKYGDIIEFSWKGRFCFIVKLASILLGLFKSRRSYRSCESNESKRLRWKYFRC